MKLAWVLCLCVLLCCAFLLAPVSAGGTSCSGRECGLGSFEKETPEVDTDVEEDSSTAEQEAEEARAKADAKATAKALRAEARAEEKEKARLARVERARAAYHALVSSPSCAPINLRAPWGQTCPNYSWFNCATRGTVSGYKVKVVPAGLVLFHGSTTIPPPEVVAKMDAAPTPPSLEYYSGYQTAVYYRDRDDWDRGSYPKIHVFRTTGQFPVVDIMDLGNQKLMNDVLVEALRGVADTKGMSSDYPMLSITGWPGSLRRVSVRDTDRLAFQLLCKDWAPKGIWGFAGYYDVGAFHPELVLCKGHGSVAKYDHFNSRHWTEEEKKYLPNHEAPDFKKLCKEN